MSNNNFSYRNTAYYKLISKKALYEKDFSASPEEELSLLEDLQANILKHHKRNYACHVFINFKDSESGRADAVNWIEGLSLTSTQTQLDQRGSAGLIEPIVCFYLSREGYEYFGVPHLAPSRCCAFEEGLKAEGRGKDITEGFQVDDDDGLFYKGKELKKFHAMLLVAHDSQDIFDEKLDEVLGAKNTFSSIEKQYALLNKVTLENDRSEVRDWFGFVDGISGPQFFPNRSYPIPEKNIGNLKSIVVKDPAGLYEKSFGSYMVFLKMRQNLGAYNALKNKINNLIINDDLSEAYILGRFKENSEPVTLTDGSIDVRNEDFDYKEMYEGKNDDKGIRCPFHAHIRKANPRDDANYEDRVIHRRGMSYIESVENADDLMPIPTKNDTIEQTAKDNEVGLVFLSFQASIEKQFEFIVQNRLHSNTYLGNGIKVGKDVLTAKLNDDEKEKFYIPTKWNGELSEDKVVTRDEAIVELLGGQYFFAPAISSLTRIAEEVKASGKEIVIGQKTKSPKTIAKLNRDKKTGAMIVGIDPIDGIFDINLEAIEQESKPPLA